MLLPSFSSFSSSLILLVISVFRDFTSFFFGVLCRLLVIVEGIWENNVDESNLCNALCKRSVGGVRDWHPGW